MSNIKRNLIHVPFRDKRCTAFIRAGTQRLSRGDRVDDVRQCSAGMIAIRFGSENSIASTDFESDC